jgi:hypothetical protein
MRNSRTFIAAVSLCIAVTSCAQFPTVTDDDANAAPGVWKDAKPIDKIKALTVAEVDAKRQLAERIYGHQISGGITVHDFVLGDNNIKNQIDAMMKGAKQVKKPTYTEHGIVYGYYAVKLRTVYEVVKTVATSRGNKAVVEAIEREIVNEDRIIEAMGNGALPGSRGMRRIRAKRAAEMDGFRQMAELVTGVRVTGETQVRDFMLEDDKIQVAFAAVIKGLKPTEITFDDDDSASVTMTMTVREVIETVETIVRTHKRGRHTSREEIERLNQHVQDKHFTVTGHGAPRDDTGTYGTVETQYEQERKIIRRIISTDIVVD